MPSVRAIASRSPSGLGMLPIGSVGIPVIVSALCLWFVGGNNRDAIGRSVNVIEPFQRLIIASPGSSARWQWAVGNRRALRPPFKINPVNAHVREADTLLEN